MQRTIQPIPLLIAGTLAIVVLVFMVMRMRPSVVQGPTDLAALHRTWQQAVSSTAAELTPAASATDIRVARESLLLLRVTAEDRASHAQLIFLLVAFERGDRSAYQRMEQLAAQIRQLP